MSTVKLDLKHGLVTIDLALIAVVENGDLTGPTARLFSRRTRTDEGHTHYCLSKKPIFVETPSTWQSRWEPEE